MLSVNKALYDSRSIYNFIDTSVRWMADNVPGLTASKEYWLFYFVKDDFSANLLSLYNANIEQDFLGFPLIRKNTRHAVESFLDLYNYCTDQDYMDVLKYCAHKQKNVGKYSAYLYKGQISIQSKCKIAKEKYDGDFQFLVDISKESNAYIHPNVFVDVISASETDKKERILKELLGANIILLDQAYNLLLKKFNQNIQPYLSCCINGQCCQCHQRAYSVFLNTINTQLLIEIGQAPIIFQY